tara:strand:- start:193 stop:447 length:255 start_codon:yes stop_codon:yes gene_type:complete
MQLVKESSTQWLGNGMGTTTADWVIKGAEHIKVYKLFGGWRVQDTLRNLTLVRHAETRKQALELYAQCYKAKPLSDRLPTDWVI